MAPHSSTLAWQIPWTEEPGGLQFMGLLGVGHDWATHFDFSLSCTGEGNGNPLQCSCLENPRDWGAWWAAVYGVTQSRTRLKRLAAAAAAVCIYWSQTTNLSLPTPFPFGNHKFVFSFMYLFWLHWVFIAARGLSLAAESGGYSLVALCQLLTAVTSLVAEHRLQVHGLQ